MSNTPIRFDITNQIARIVLDRPAKRNALSQELIAQLTKAVEAVAADESVRLLVLSAEGSVFCAGMDLGEMQARAAQPNAAELWQQDTQVYCDLLAALFTLEIPTLAVVQGPALAGGVGLVLACDMVLAAEESFFSLPEPKRGITAAVLSPFLVYRIGAGNATYLLLSGEKISSADAHRIGLCHEIVPAGRLAERQKQLCDSILTGAPSALAKTKQHLIDSSGSVLRGQLNAAMRISAEARETPDAREGLAAFLQKRPPSWIPWPESFS